MSSSLCLYEEDDTLFVFGDSIHSENSGCEKEKPSQLDTELKALYTLSDVHYKQE